MSILLSICLVLSCIFLYIGVQVGSNQNAPTHAHQNSNFNSPNPTY